MAQFTYKAANAVGKITKGKMNAANPDALKEKLLESKLFLLEYSEEVKSHGKRLKALDLSEFCRELGSMLGSGVSLVRTMNILIGCEMPPKIKNVFVDLNTQIKRGVSLSDAMIMQGKTFPDLLINMIKSGEASGRMDNVCSKMAVHYEKEHRLNQEIRGAMTYPLILLVMTVLVIIGIFTFIFPTFMDLFNGMELPLITQIMITISEIFTKQWYLVAIVVGALVLLIAFAAQIEAVIYTVHKMLIRMPKIGKLLRTIYTARFARTLSSLYSSGLSILNALQISKNTIGNKYIEKQFDDVLKNIRAGIPLSAALLQVDGFEKKLSQTIVVGEETGKLDDLLESIAENYEYDSSVAIKKMVKMIEPIMIAVMALIIAIVMMSVMLPIYNMYGNIGDGQL